MIFECLQMYSSFKDDNLKLPKKGYCKIEFMNELNINYALLSLIFTNDRDLYYENIEYHLKTHKVKF